jgi:ABC-type glutathione transport system ATPase component
VSRPAGGYELTLPGGARQTLLAGASLAVMGEDASAVVAAFAQPHGAALLVPDAADPLHAGYAVADQIAAALSGTRRSALDRATDLLELVDVPEPHHRARARPDQLSQLDRQRAQLALALVNAPTLIAAEDPTAGLSQAEASAFAALLSRLRDRLGFTLVLATQQLEAAQRLADEIIVLGDGGIVERRRRRGAQATSSSTSSST